MKKYLILIALLSAVVLASGCVDSGNQTTNQTSGIATKSYTNDTAGYSFEYPENWQKMDLNNTKGVGFIDRATNTNVIISTFQSGKEPTDQELETAIDEILSSYNQTIKGIEGLEKVSGNTVTINGVKGVDIVYKYSINSREVQQRQVWLFKGETGYILTFTADPSEYGEQSKYFDVIINSFKIQ